MAVTKPALPTSSTQALALQAKYSPQTAARVQRSQYLAEALKQNLAGGSNIRGGGWELGSRLLAQAILQNASTKADQSAVGALRSDENSRIAAALAGLGEDATAFTPSPAAAPANDDRAGLLGSIVRGVFGSKPQAPDSTQQPAASATDAPAPDQGKTGGVQVSNGAYSEVVSPRQLAKAAVDAPTTSGTFMPAPPPAPLQPRDPGMSVPSPQPPPAAAPATSAPYSPQDRDALTRMLVVEAGGEGPQGMAAAGHVALNRLKGGYGGAKSLSDVVFQPHQFEGISRAGQVRPEDYAAAQQVADGILSGQVPDPTGGAMAFLNPDLQRQLGRNIPGWAQGQGQRIGNHVFFGGRSADAQAPGGPAPQGSPQGAPTMAAGQGQPAPDAQPYQVAANGPTPSPPGSAMPQPSPQPASQGAPQPQPQGSFPPRQITDAQRTLLMQYLNSSDPTMRAQGLAYAQDLQKKNAEETKYEFTTKDGVPIWADPYHPGQLYAGAVPEALRTHVLTDEEASRYKVPPGTVIQQSPDGQLKFERPAEGQMVTSRPGEPYRESYIPGSKSDPTRPQAPQQGYRYAGPADSPAAHQEVIPGSGQDPRNPTALLEGTKGIRSEVAPFVQSAVGLQRNINAVRAGVTQRTGSGDIAAVTGLQKLIDEGVVQAGEMNNQLNAQGLAGGIAGVTAYLQSNGKFDDATRQKIHAAAEAVYSANNRSLRDRVTGYRSIVDSAYGPGTFDRFVFTPQMGSDLGWSGGQPGGASAAPVDPDLALAVSRGIPLSPQMQAAARQQGLIR